MLAYNPGDLNNRSLQSITEKAFRAELITTEEQFSIASTYPVKFYSPNIFVRIGLAILTLLAISALTGIFVLLDDGDHFENLLILLGIACFTGLEIFVQKWKHYGSGIDDMLLHVGILFILGGLALVFDFTATEQGLLISSVACLLYLAGFIRYLDRLSAVLALAALVLLVSFVFKTVTTIPGVPLFLVVAFIMGICFLLLHRLKGSKKYPYHEDGLTFMEYGTVFIGYGALHYFILDKLLWFDGSGGGLKDPSLTGWLSWAWTILIPPLLLNWSIRKKNIPYFRISLILLFAMILFLQYHFHLIDHEWAALLIGILLISISYMVIKHLKTNNSEFTDDPGTNDTGWLLTETLAISAGFAAQASGIPQTGPNHTQFGGGDFGGGGAGGQF